MSELASTAEAHDMQTAAYYADLEKLPLLGLGEVLAKVFVDNHLKAVEKDGCPSCINRRLE